MAPKIPASLNRFAKYIDSIEDYRSQGPDGDGYWVHLKPGWICTLTEVHSVHEDNITQCLEVFKAGFLDECCCAECQRIIKERNEKEEL